MAARALGATATVWTETAHADRLPVTPISLVSSDSGWIAGLGDGDDPEQVRVLFGVGGIGFAAFSGADDGKGDGWLHQLLQDGPRERLETVKFQVATAAAALLFVLAATLVGAQRTAAVTGLSTSTRV